MRVPGAVEHPDPAGAVRRHGGRAAPRAGHTGPCCRNAWSTDGHAIGRAAGERRAGGGSVFARHLAAEYRIGSQLGDRSPLQRTPSDEDGEDGSPDHVRSSPRKGRPCRIRCASAGAGCSETAPVAGKGRQVAAIILDNSPARRGSVPSGSPSPTSCWRTRDATGALIGRAARSDVIPLGNFRQGAEDTRFRRGASCSRPTPRCARRPARGSPRGWSRSSSGWRAHWTKRTATPSTGR